MPIPDTFEIEHIAKRVFEGALPPKWLVREQKPDFHLDYCVELEAHSAPSGIVFGVQLKGTRSPRYSGDHIAYSMEREHLAYFIDKAQFPVFLVVVDVETREGYWLFMQEWIAGSLKNRPWRRQKTVSVPVPLANRIGDSGALRAAVMQAETYMRELRPGTVQAAVSATRRDLERLDENIAVDVSYRGGVTHIGLTAREAIQVDLKFGGETVSTRLREKISDLFNRGVEVRFEPGEFKIEGSAVFDYFSDSIARHGVTAQIATRRSCDFCLSVVDEKGATLFSLPNFAGALEGGLREVRFAGQLPRSPLSVSGTLKQGTDEIDLQFNFQFDQWAGQRLLHAAHFDSIDRMLQSIQAGNRIRIACEIDGNPVFSGAITAPDFVVTMGAFVPLTSLISKARDLGRKYNANPVIPRQEQLSAMDHFHVDMLWAIAHQGVFRCNLDSFSANVTLIPGEELLRQIRKKRQEGVLIFVPEQVCLFDMPLHGLRVRHELPAGSLTRASKSALYGYRPSVAEGVRVRWEGRKGTEMVVRAVHGEGPA